MNPATMSRPFEKGDRVRVVKLSPGSSLRDSAAKIGDVFTISALGSFGCIAIAELNNGHFQGDQFALVVDTPPAPAPTFTPGTRVTLPDGAVATVTSVTTGGAVLVNGEAYDPARLTLAPPPPLVVPDDADTMLRTLDAFLVRNNTQSQRVQSVLSALRGPDRDEDEGRKSSTTNAVRRAALPLCAEAYDADQRWLGNTINGCSFTRKPYAPPTGSGHFDDHIDSAVRALRAIGREVQ